MFPPELPASDASAVPAEARIIDVREPDEWDAGHIEGATHIPLADLPGRLDELPAGETLYVVCRVGGRSARAVAWLTHNGYDAVNVNGGMDAWVSAGRPMVSETGESPAVL